MGQYWWIIIVVAVVVMIFYVTISRRRKKSESTSQEAYINGLRSIISGDNQNAFLKLRQAVDLDTENIDAYLKLGDLFREKGMTERALQIHKELTLRRDIPPELSNDISKSLVLDYLEVGSKEKAIDLLKPMIRQDEIRNWAEEKLLNLYIAVKMWEEADDLFASILKRKKLKESATMANLKIMIGRRHQNLGEYHKARVVYKEALSFDKNNPFSYIYIAESYRQEDRVDDALDYLKKLCEEVPRYAYLAFSAIEETFFEMGRFGEVEDIYRGVLKNDPDNIPAKIALAGIFEKKGEIQTAEGMLRSVLEADGANSAAAIRLAKILAGDGRTREGLEILSDAADKIDLSYDIYKCKVCGQSLKRPEPCCSRCNNLGTFI